MNRSALEKSFVAAASGSPRGRLARQSQVTGGIKGPPAAMSLYDVDAITARGLDALSSPRSRLSDHHRAAGCIARLGPGRHHIA